MNFNQINKKTIIVFVLLFLYLVACDSSIEIEGDLKRIYSVGCILNNQDSIQTIFLSKSYNSSNTVDTLIEEPQIRVWYKDSVVFFKKALHAGGYKYIAKFDVLPDTKYELEIITPDNKKITAKTYSPPSLKIIPDSYDYIIPMNDEDKNFKDEIVFKWESAENNYFLYYPLAIIRYKLLNDNTDKVYKLVLPQEIRKVDNKEFEVYTTPQYSTIYKSNIKVLLRTLKKLYDENNFKDIKLLSYNFLLINYDQHLSNYFNSTYIFKDSYSVSLEYIDYGNVNNAKGVFSTAFAFNKFLLFSKKYFADLGFEIN